jgi:predicted TPR repeat methyltransferase
VAPDGGNKHEMAARGHEFALGELANGRPAAAVTALKQALELDPRNVAAHQSLGLALEELGRLDEAEAAYRSALRVDPAHGVAYRSLGELLQRRGRLEEACGCFQSALSLNHALNHSRLCLGSALADLGKLEEAASCYREAIAGSPAPAGVYALLGAVLWKLGDSAGALDAFERSVAGSQGSAEAYYNLGSAQLDSRRFDDALRSAREALRLRPGFAEAAMLCAAALAAAGAAGTGVELLQRFGGAGASLAAQYLALAIRLMNSRLFEPARACLERVLREEPGEVMARHLFSALSGENPDHPTEGYVRRLFDSSAATFDRDLVSKLGYGIPREMVEALRAVEAAPGNPWDVLDLGCGTGLVGAEVAPYSGALVGVDLAPNMIERARGRGIYTDLRCADLMLALTQEEARQRRYDVVTAADVFIYVGRLDEVIPAIRRLLRPGGLFAFSAEASEASGSPTGAGYRLGMMGRYAHSAVYLRRLAAESRFDVEVLRQSRIRFEHRRPVEGWLTVWRAA